MSKNPTQLLEQLTDRDLRILDAVERHRLVTTRQIQRLHFPVGQNHKSQTAATKATLRVLHRLQGHGLIQTLRRRIGGLHAGSAGYVWYLDSTGAWLQRHRAGRTKRSRYNPPSTEFMRHRVAVGDIAVTLCELDRAGDIQLLHLQLEPECWRDFLGPHGAPVTLKPDLFFAYRVGDWEEYRFVEVDLGSENLQKIGRKIEIYLQHLNTGREARRWGVHPSVTWLAPDAPRTQALQTALEGHEGVPAGFMDALEASLFADSIKRPKEATT